MYLSHIHNTMKQHLGLKLLRLSNVFWESTLVYIYIYIQRERERERERELERERERGKYASESTNYHLSRSRKGLYLLKNYEFLKEFTSNSGKPMNSYNKIEIYAWNYEFLKEFIGNSASGKGVRSCGSSLTCTCAGGQDDVSQNKLPQIIETRVISPQGAIPHLIFAK